MQRLRIDVDKPYNVCRRIYHMIVQEYNRAAARLGLPRVVHYMVEASPSLRCHVTVLLEQGVDCAERYIIARLLGDDPARSLLNLWRCRRGCDADLLFYEKREKEREQVDAQVSG